MALAGFTDAYGKGSGNADRMRASSKVITIMLRTWSGTSFLFSGCTEGCAHSTMHLVRRIDVSLHGRYESY